MKNINTFQDLLIYTEKNNLKIFEVCQLVEAQENETCEKYIREKVKKTLDIMKETIQNGLASKEPSTGKMTGFDCDKLQTYYKSQASLFSPNAQKAILYALATAEENARMGRIAACPTAGACGIVPAIIMAFCDNEEDQINALITAGQIGKIVSNKVAMAGAIMGCQGECGTAAAMAASALAAIKGGNSMQIISAAVLTIKNILGLVCDPVAGLVEVPCVKRNTFMTTNAITGAELALSGITSVIPPDEVIDAMYQVGTFMSPQLKESSEAGLATTKTGLKISQKMQLMYHN